MSKERAKKLKERFGTLKSQRQPFDPVWQEVAEFMGADYVGFTGKRQHPVKPRFDVVDSTARRAANVFAAGMLSGSCSPSQRWFDLSLDDKDLAKFGPVRSWLQDLFEMFSRTLSQGGFYSQQTVGFFQTGLFGWQCMFVDEDPGKVTDGVRFRSIPLESIYIDENAQGEVDCVFRSFKLTGRQAVGKWGEAVSSKVKEEKNKDTSFDFVHAVFQREGHNPDALGPERLRFESVYFETQEDLVISEGGYAELPYILPRAKRLPGTPYTYSQGTEALADTKMINEMKRLILESGQLTVAPPYLVPDDGFVGRFSFEPRAMNYYRRAEGNSAADFGPLNVGGNPNFSWELLNATKQDINEAFYVDLFMALRTRMDQGGTPTAHEVAELAGEKMFLLGPLLIQQMRENFGPLFNRLYALHDRREEIPPPPKEVLGRNLEPEYISPLMQSMKEDQVVSMLQTYQEAQAIAGIAPEVLDLFNHDENMRRIMLQRGFPAKGMRTRQQVEEIRAQRQQAQQAAEQTAMLQQAAEAAPKLAKAPEDGSPAQELLQQMQGGQ